MKDFECSGFWWLPGAEGPPTAGTLYVSGSGDLRLKLIGSLGELEGVSLTKHHTIVLGSVDKSPRGNEVTLVGCVVASSSIGTYAGGREEYRAGAAYFGAHLEVESDFTFRGCVVEIGGLSEWASSLSGLRGNAGRLPSARDIGEAVPLAMYRVHAPLTASVQGAAVTLGMGVENKTDATMFRSQERANIAFDFDPPLTAADVNEGYVHPLQNLMTFVSDRAQGVERVALWRSEDRTDWRSNPAIHLVVPRIQPDDFKPGRKPTRDDEMLFALSDIDLGALLGSWLKLSKTYSSAFDIFFGMEYAPPTYIDLTYASLAQVLSLFYVRTPAGAASRETDGARFREIIGALPPQAGEWLVDHLGSRPRPPFQTILRALVEQHGPALDPMLGRRRDRFVNTAANALLYIERREDDDSSLAVHGPDLYWLIQRMRFVLKSCLMSELGFTPEDILHRFERNKLYRLMIGQTSESEHDV